jgi:FlaA1/EpsC-like NDP-sugar epimerase
MSRKMNLGQTILELPRVAKRGFALILDAFLCISSVAIAYLLRLDSWIFPTGTQWLSYGAAIIFSIPLFITFGLYRAIFRYAGWGALMGVVRACAVYGVIYSLIFTAVGVAGVPRTVGVLQPVLLFLFVGASRAFARYWLGGGYQFLLKLGQRRRVLIYGVGSAGRQLSAALANSEEMQVIGFVDDDKSLQSSVLNGKQIYAPGDLTGLIERLEIDDLLLALPSASRQRRNEIIASVRGSKATVRTLPGLSDLAHGRVLVSDLRELEIEDLLGRDAVPPNHLLLTKNITGKTVLVSGAGGSIGSELCRQIFALNPDRLVLIEQSEFNLYAIDQELVQRKAELECQTEIVPVLASVLDEVRMDRTIERYRPKTIYHAAAYKHVPLVEMNPAEGIRNNVFGTLNIAQIAEKHGVSDFVLISTDKAVRPTNVMGATKRLAEMVLQAIAARGSATRFSMVRFGNVLGSSGSVVPLFRKQIKAGGPITVTHEAITRYFMTIPEAAQLVIQAGAMAQGGEVFVLDMGDPVKIVDLARRMIELSGLSLRDADTPDGDIEIQIVGLRPAEKLYEELLIGDDPKPTAHAQIMMARDGHPVWSDLNKELKQIEAELGDGSTETLRKILSRLVPELTNIPDEDVVRALSA